MVSELTTHCDWIAKLERRGRLWIVPEFKIVFVSVAKNACTSIKWVLTDLAREDASKIKAGFRAQIDDLAAVHNRRLHPNIRFAGQLDPRIRADIHPDNGWFVFGVVRDPRARLFSAWQDRVLLAHPAQDYRRWSSESWYPAQPGEDAETINRQFADFVDAAVTRENFPPRQNTHFRSQTEGLDVDRIPYTAIYPIEKLDDLRADLTRHVELLGWTQPITFRRRSSDAPLPANAAVFAGDVRAKIEQWYASDFAEFGDHFDFSRIAAVPDWTAAQLREVQVRAALHRRLGDVRQIALKQRKRAEKAVKRANNGLAKPDGTTALKVAPPNRQPSKPVAASAESSTEQSWRTRRGASDRLRRRLQRMQQRRANGGRRKAERSAALLWRSATIKFWCLGDTRGWRARVRSHR